MARRGDAAPPRLAACR
uniref:Uncharacterized protein n=1 Tax=Arundo donax TaxID=35708 RepID=A0A0A9B5Y5_ARUDO